MADDTPLAGKVALVAGATRGAGRAIAIELARVGAYVYATGRSSRTAGRGVGLSGGRAGLWVALRSLGLLALSAVSGAHESGEPNGEPTTADIRPGQATTGDSCCS